MLAEEATKYLPGSSGARPTTLSRSGKLVFRHPFRMHSTAAVEDFQDATRISRTADATRRDMFACSRAFLVHPRPPTFVVIADGHPSFLMLCFHQQEVCLSSCRGENVFVQPRRPLPCGLAQTLCYA